MPDILEKYHVADKWRGVGYTIGRIGDPVILHSDLDLLYDSLYQIFNTKRGERVGFPEFGSDLPALLFEPNDPYLYQQIEAEVRQAIALWEPRVIVYEVQCEATPQDLNSGQLYVTLTVAAINNPRVTTFRVPISSTGRLFS